jgi:hypothetical protein
MKVCGRLSLTEINVMIAKILVVHTNLKNLNVVRHHGHPFPGGSYKVFVKSLDWSMGKSGRQSRDTAEYVGTGLWSHTECFAVGSGLGFNLWVAPSP